MLTALVFAAWRYGGATTNVPALQKQQHAHGLTLVGVGRGSYVVVRRTSKAGQILFSGTIAHGHHEQFIGARFYVFARRPGGVGIRRSPGVTLVRK